MNSDENQETDENQEEQENQKIFDMMKLRHVDEECIIETINALEHHKQNHVQNDDSVEKAISVLNDVIREYSLDNDSIIEAFKCGNNALKAKIDDCDPESNVQSKMIKLYERTLKGLSNVEARYKLVKRVYNRRAKKGSVDNA